MKWITGIIFVVLILLILGLYYIPDTTKDVMQTTGSVAKDAGEIVIDHIKESETVQNITEKVKEKIPIS